MISWWFRLIGASIATHWRITLARPTFQITLVVQPIVMISIMYIIFRRHGSSAELVEFVLLGSGLAGVWSSLVFSSAGDINRERFYGTLPSLTLAPAPLILIFYGKLIANGLLSVISLAVGLVFGRLALNLPLSLPDPLAFVTALIVFLLAANALALFLSCLFLLSRMTAVLQNFLEYPLLIVSGLFFPLTLLPTWAQAIGWCNPLTWGGEALRISIHAGWTSSYWQAIGLDALLAAIYTALSVGLIAQIERRVRKTASLEII